MKFLFWNLNHSSSAAIQAAELIRDYDVDVAIFAECSNYAGIIEAINSHQTRYFPLSLSSRLKVVVRSPEAERRLLRDEKKFAAFELYAATMPLVIVGVHLPSGLHMAVESRSEEARVLSRTIHEIESLISHKNTILIGDFNLDPFDAGIAHSGGVHAVNDRVLAKEISRTIQERDYFFFYNPMWRFMHDSHGQSPGTYFYRQAAHDAYFWHTFDQFLIRPSLIDSLPEDGVQVIDSIAGQSLLNSKNRPDSVKSSDHLPILLELNIEGRS